MIALLISAAPAHAARHRSAPPPAGSAADEASRPVARRDGGTVRETGIASCYGERQAGDRTASGERVDPKRMTAASKSLPLGSMARVTNLENGRSIQVRINDRGPFVKNRVIDLSDCAAVALAMRRQGVAKVKVELVALNGARSRVTGRAG